MVENQDAVLKRLKSASDSFEELDTEIRAIKEQFIENQMRRSIILDDLEYEKMYNTEQIAREQEFTNQRRGMKGMAAVGGAARGEDDYSHGELDYASKRSQFAGASRYSGGLYRAGEASAAVEDDYESYSSPIPRRRASEETSLQLDKDLENDVLTRGPLAGLALRGDTQRYKTAYDETSTARRTYGSSRYQGLDDYSSPYKKRGRSLSMYEQQDDVDYEPDFTTRSPYRSDIQRRRAGGFVRAEAEEEDRPLGGTAYRTPNLPSYRKYDVNASLDGGVGLSSHYLSSARAVGADNDSETSSGRASSRTGRFARAKTLDYGTSSMSSFRSPSAGGRYGYASTTKSSFNSRFLNKVREKKAGGEDITRDKPFTSRFLGKSFDTPSGPGISSARTPAKDNENSDTKSSN